MLRHWWMIALSVLSVGYLFFLSSTFQRNVDTSFISQTSESSVRIELLPQRFENEKLYVDIRVDTHTVELSQFNLYELVTLETNGNVLSPLNAPSLEGHHSSGTLVFTMTNLPEDFTITIRKFPDIPIRTFRW